MSKTVLGTEEPFASWVRAAGQRPGKTIRISAGDSVRASGWDGGSKDEATLVHIHTNATQYVCGESSYFGSPRVPPTPIPVDYVAVEYGYFCGKPSKPQITMPQEAFAAWEVTHNAEIARLKGIEAELQVAEDAAQVARDAALACECGLDSCQVGGLSFAVDADVARLTLCLPEGFRQKAIEPSKRDKEILKILGYKSSYRKQELERSKVTPDEIQTFVQRGWLKINKAGAQTLTPEGRIART